MAFKELMHKIQERIKHWPYFCQPSKIGEDPTRRNQSFYYTYHQDKGYTTKQCRTFKDHLEQLVKTRHSREFMVNQGRVITGQTLGNRGGAQPPPFGIIEVIHATLINVSANCWRGIINTTTQQEHKTLDRPRKRPKMAGGQIAFDANNLEGTSQPNNDTFIVTLRI